MHEQVRLREIARLFLKLGIIGFGGPAAHIAMMRDEVVHKRKWMDDQKFVDLLGATNLIPGPNSTELAIHIGYDKGGWRGLILAGICFILPAVLITGVFAWLYKEYGHLPLVHQFIYGIKPAIIAIIINALLPLIKTSFKNTFLLVIGVLVFVLSFLGISELYLMFGAGISALAIHYYQHHSRNQLSSIIPLLFVSSFHEGLFSPKNITLFWIFLKIGAVLYGSGYVLFAFLDTELVATGMLSRQQLIDAIAVGQFSPGPVFSSVTFIGYQINGWTGALLSTIAIFTPSFLLVALLVPLLKKMRNSAAFSSFLDAVNVSAIAMIAVVCFEMGKETISNWQTILIALLSMAILLRFPKMNSAFIIIGGAVLGYCLTRL
ncbi:chromate efflux transporter [Sphingobacterium yanglingense]|uniref:Chromate transporter n=1 Tax=Sphingobacterium yanglingense TaxID=1437280 RepID=A0A4R6WMI4_9SPHI|nr:chromate efflux transporter [Sphingobacterium yanglingense]TDQ80038.1 chromate transporter [Sphingobacterium yanglingense]